MSVPLDFFGFFFFVLCSPPFSVFASSASRPLLLFFLVLWSLFFSLSLSFSLSLDTDTPGLCEMGVVFSSLWHWMFPGKEYKIVMVRSEEEEEEEEEEETKEEASTTTTIDCMCRPLSLLFLSLSLACSMP